MFPYMQILKINSTNHEQLINKLVDDVDNLFTIKRPTFSGDGVLLIGVDLKSGIKFNLELFDDEDKIFIYAQNKHDLIPVSKTIRQVLGL